MRTKLCTGLYRCCAALHFLRISKLAWGFPSLLCPRRRCFSPRSAFSVHKWGYLLALFFKSIQTYSKSSISIGSGLASTDPAVAFMHILSWLSLGPTISRHVRGWSGTFRHPSTKRPRSWSTVEGRMVWKYLRSPWSHSTSLTPDISRGLVGSQAEALSFVTDLISLVRALCTQRKKPVLSSPCLKPKAAYAQEAIDRRDHLFRAMPFEEASRIPREETRVALRGERPPDGRKYIFPYQDSRFNSLCPVFPPSLLFLTSTPDMAHKNQPTHKPPRTTIHHKQGLKFRLCDPTWPTNVPLPPPCHRGVHIPTRGRQPEE